MLELLRHVVWFFLVASAIAYMLFIAIGSVIHAEARGSTRVITVRDAYQPGQHNLSGMVMVPETCQQLVLSTQQTDSQEFTLAFTTWREPYVPCQREDTPRSFRAVLFAPSIGVNFFASLDDAPLYISVVPVKSYQH